MISLRNVAFPGLFGLVWLLAMAGPAYGYIDPGTGSYFFQLLIATIVGAGFAIKMYWRRLVAFFAGRKAQLDEEEDEE